MTPIFAGGGRRSAAPTFARVDPRQSQAIVADPDLLRRIIFGDTTQSVVGGSSAGNSVAEAFGRGTFTESGQGSGQTSTTGGNGFTGSPAAGAMASQFGAGLSALGGLTGNQTAANIGGLLGTAGSLSQSTPQQALGTIGMLGAQALGIPGGALAMGKAALDGNIALGINGALSLANPAFGIVNSLGSMLGLGTIGSNVANGLQNLSLGATVSPAAGFVDQAKAGFSINNSVDPLGSLISQMAAEWGISLDDPASPTSAASRGYGDGGFDSSTGATGVNGSAGTGDGDSGFGGGGFSGGTANA